MDTDYTKEYPTNMAEDIIVTKMNRGELTWHIRKREKEQQPKGKGRGESFGTTHKRSTEKEEASKVKSTEEKLAI